MNTTDFLLRFFSIAILFLLVFQLFLSNGGSERHKVVGTITMVSGAIIAILVTIRGLQNKEVFTFYYALHLLFGTLFFFLLFKTGYLGYKSVKDQKFSLSHKKYARFTLVFLVSTLIVGIVSFLSH